MLNVSCKIQKQDGSMAEILILSHRYCPKFKVEFITYTTLDKPESNFIVPLIREENKWYVDYSYSVKKLMDLGKALSIPCASKISGDILIKGGVVPSDEPIIETEEEVEEKEPKKQRVVKTESVVENKTSKKVVKTESIDVKEDKNKKPCFLIVRLNDKLHMTFRIIKTEGKNYICEKVKGNNIQCEEDYDIIRTTFTIANYYKLEGESNITTANNMYTKISKDLIVDDKEEIHVLIVKYINKCYAYFILKEETPDAYIIEPTTYDYIKNRPYDLIIKTIDNENAYRKFLEKYEHAYRNKTSLELQKSTKKEVKVDLEHTALLNISAETEEDDEDIEYDYENVRKTA